MSDKRKHYSAPDKVNILRLHLLEKKPVSDLSVLSATFQVAGAPL